MNKFELLDSEYGDDISLLISHFSRRHALEGRPLIGRDLSDICNRLGDLKIIRRLLHQINDHFHLIPDPAAAMTGLDRLIAIQPEPVNFISRLLDQAHSFQRLLLCLGTSTFFTQTILSHSTLIPALLYFNNDSEYSLRKDALAIVNDLDNEKQVSEALRRFRHRITLAIAAKDLFEHSQLPKTTQAISDLADACLNAALEWSVSRNAKKYGQPRTSSGEPCRLVAMALGKLGGQELNYSSDVDLIFIYDEDGQTPGPRPLPALEFFTRVITDFLKVMSGAGSAGFVLRVDLRLRPEGAQGPMVMSLEQTLNYYDSVGRTWERQALIKVRPCAGATEIGIEFQSQIEPFVYRRYLTSIEIAEIQAMKRRIENRSQVAGMAETDVKTGYGGIRDVEFVVQFLQLLNGCTLQKLRCNNTLNSLLFLKETGCLTSDEETVLRSNYIYLRQVEHRLQLMDDRQTHRIPQSGLAKQQLARLMGHQPLNAWESADAPFERFYREYQKITAENREILNKLLHNTFQLESEHGPNLITDLILDPEMPQELVDQALGPIGFKNKGAAIKLLGFMAREEKLYFSTPRCRHFFAAIAPKLLHAISKTIDPDRTLNHIETISRPISGKVALWESLLNSSIATDSIVQIAAYQKVTVDLLTARSDAWETWREALHHQIPTSLQQIEIEFQQNANNQADPSKVIKSIRDKYWLSISSRIHLPIASEDLFAISASIEKLASHLIMVASQKLWHEALQRWRLNIKSDALPGKWAVIGMGKLGGSELLFHSDIDLLFLHEINHDFNSEQLKIQADAFFQELATKLIRMLDGGGNATIYRVDTRLRPYGNSGPLSVSMSSLSSYYSCTEARVWEKLALLRSRPIVLNGFDSNKIVELLHQLTCGSGLNQALLISEITNLRKRTLDESDMAGNDLKRSAGGIHEIEIIVQGLQLSGFQLLSEPPEKQTINAIKQLARHRLINDDQAITLKEAYLFFRQIDFALRLFRNRTSKNIEIQPDEIATLERMINDQSATADLPFLEKIAFHQGRVNRLFHQFFSGPDVSKTSAII